MSRINEDNPFSFESFGMKPPLLFVSPDADYAAVFACGEHVAVLESQEGRCIRARPVRREITPNPYETVTREFEARGFVLQDLGEQDLATFVAQFMQVAGFTPDHLLRTFQICQR